MSTFCFFLSQVGSIDSIDREALNQ